MLTLLNWSKKIISFDGESELNLSDLTNADDQDL